MTRKAASSMKRKADWSKALAEGRIVRFSLSLTSYPTVEKAQAAVAKIGNGAEIVKVRQRRR